MCFARIDLNLDPFAAQKFTERTMFNAL
jgi:hypothetical protein